LKIATKISDKMLDLWQVYLTSDLSREW